MKVLCFLDISIDNSGDETLKLIATLHKLSTVRWQPSSRLVFCFVLRLARLDFLLCFQWYRVAKRTSIITTNCYQRASI